MPFLTGHDLAFALNLLISLLAGFLIGAERESRGKAAGISTHCLVIAGSMIFAYISALADPLSPARVIAQIVTGVGFLGAGIILKGDGGKITNLTTAASVWFAAAIGILIGMGLYIVALLATIFSVAIPRIPHVKGSKFDRDNGG